MKKKTPNVLIFPRECSCHVLAIGETSYFNDESKMRHRHAVATRSVRSARCKVHAPHRYMPRFVSADR